MIMSRLSIIDDCMQTILLLRNVFTQHPHSSSSFSLSINNMISPTPNSTSIITIDSETPTPTPTHRLTWLISGTSSGFGYRIALLAIRRGDNVLATARSLLKLQKLVDQVAALSDPTAKDRLKTFRLELGDPEQVVKGVIDEAVKVWGRIDVLVNNAGTRKPFFFFLRLWLTYAYRLGVAGSDRRNGVHHLCLLSTRD